MRGKVDITITENIPCPGAAMKPIWRFTLYSDLHEKIPCFIAYVESATEREALTQLRTELRTIPVKLRVGELLASVPCVPAEKLAERVRTESTSVYLFKPD